MRKVPLVLALLTGMELTQGAITQVCPEHRPRDALRRPKGTVGARLPGIAPLRTGLPSGLHRWHRLACWWQLSPPDGL
jgi:hypothetical protein